MNQKRDIDDLLQDPEFLSSPECACFHELVNKGVCLNLKEAFLYWFKVFERAKEEDHASWPDDIQAGIEAERSGKIFPPMLHIADSLLDVLDAGTPHIIPKESWDMLINFLKGEHRGQKGAKITPFSRQCDVDVLNLYQHHIESGLSPTQAHEQLATSQRVDVRTIQRTLKRAKQYRETDEMCDSLSKYNMSRFFHNNSGNANDT
jgi:hypothetical protein